MLHPVPYIENHQPIAPVRQISQPIFHKHIIQKTPGRYHPSGYSVVPTMSLLFTCQRATSFGFFTS